MVVVRLLGWGTLLFVLVHSATPHTHWLQAAFSCSFILWDFDFNHKLDARELWRGCARLHHHPHLRCSDLLCSTIPCSATGEWTTEQHRELVTLLGASNLHSFVAVWIAKVKHSSNLEQLAAGFMGVIASLRPTRPENLRAQDWLLNSIDSVLLEEDRRAFIDATEHSVYELAYCAARLDAAELATAFGWSPLKVASDRALETDLTVLSGGHIGTATQIPRQSVCQQAGNPAL